MSAAKSSASVPVICLEQDKLKQSSLAAHHLKWLRQNDFSGQTGRLLPLPDKDGAIAAYAFGMGAKNNREPLLLGAASAGLPGGTYRLEGAFGEQNLARLAFELGAYRFDRYKNKQDQAGEKDKIFLETGKDRSEEVRFLTQAAFIARDLINIPANDLGPDGFEKEIRAFARTRKMNCKVTYGDDLLTENFPMIHAVGRAGKEAPRLIELIWGKKEAPAIVLVGKGVTFDSGGLDIKSAANMLLMKKDMGGAANILGLTHAIISAGLKVHLRVILPIVENSISAAAYRPGDILPSRGGLNVEIGNTDAEGRLILADALAFASENNPELVIDMATLTGSARIALGPDLPALYSTSDRLALQVVKLGMKWGDPVWHMPLWHPYDNDLSSVAADVNHIAKGNFAGSLLAALFLARFVKNVGDWLHFDIYGWAPKARAGRPQGGTDQGIRAAFMLLKQRYGSDI